MIDSADRAEGIVEDADDAVLGRIQLGTGSVKREHGGTLCEFKSDGSVVGNHGNGLGKFEGFSFGEIRTAAMYIILIDPEMLES